MNQILNLGQELTDTTHTGKMSDEYPLKLFTMQNIITLTYNQKMEMALYFFTTDASISCTNG